MIRADHTQSWQTDSTFVEKGNRLKEATLKRLAASKCKKIREIWPVEDWWNIGDSLMAAINETSYKAPGKKSQQSVRNATEQSQCRA